ncbi:hypothetical protein RB653_006487 [Dictyostelium firmibasis]|uniref:Uncharacterized protein n=1 Tax=Dictyostelium firmibasis TaxID=79012 RepID=A0AAN7YTR7_9MYCE
MPRYTTRKQKKEKIELPLHLPTLDPTVDLQSFSNKSCNRILNQALFGKVRDESEVVILVVIKSKFSPMCRECGVGKREDKSLFLKDRFIKEGNGRVLFQLDSSISSLQYRKELCKHVYKNNTNIVILSEDRQYGYTIIGSGVPNSDTEIYNQYFVTFDHQQQQTEIKTINTNNDETITTIQQPKEQQQEQHHKTKEEQIEELQIKTSKKIEKWIKDRIEKGDTINLPKTIESLEKSIQPFCKITHSFSNNVEIIKKLSECGDIKICETCQTCKPTSTNLDNQFYFSYLSLSQEDHKQFDWLLKKIITEYTKTPTNLVPLPLVNINKFTLFEKVEIKTSIIIDYLIKNKIISLKTLDQKQPNNNTIDHSSNYESALDDNFSTNLTITSTSPIKSKPSATLFKSSYSSPRKLTTTSNYSFSPRKLTSTSSTGSNTLTPLKKAYSSSKYSYTSSSNNNNSSSSYYGNDDASSYKGKIIYNDSV